MQKTGICPKCKSNDVVDSDKPNGHRAIYHRYVCLACGFAEMYADEKHLADLKKWRDKGMYK